MTLFPVPAFSDNYIWVWHDGQRALVVDPGEASGVMDWLTQHQLTLDTILYAVPARQDPAVALVALAGTGYPCVVDPLDESFAVLADAVEAHLDTSALWAAVRAGSRSSGA